MANKNAVCKLNLSYSGPDNESVTAPLMTVSAAYALGAQLVGGIDIVDGEEAGTEHNVPFGEIAVATGLIIENKSGQELKVKLNGIPASVAGTLVAGEATLLLDEVSGEKLSVELGNDNGGTAGVLSVVRTSGTEVLVQSWLSGTGIQAADVSDVTVYNGNANATFSLPHGGFVTVVAASMATSLPLTSASVVTTATQDGAGTVVFKVFGDPTP